MANGKRSSRKKNKKNERSVWSYIWRIGLALIIALILIVVGVGAKWINEAPELTEESLQETFGSTLVDKDGTAYYTFGGQDQDVLEPNEVSDVLETAIVSIEDQRFYEHHGIDPIRIAGAAFSNFTSGGLQGGSTITQQLVKLSVFSTGKADQTIKRKVQEAWLAIQLERHYSKEQILTMYINKVYMSDNIYGMGTAAEYYYGKEVKDLTLPQAALIAGLPQAPNEYNPYNNPENAKKRRDTVLYEMVDYGAITEAQAAEASEIPIDDGLKAQDTSDGQEQIVDAYVKQALKEIEEKTDIDPYNAGATIHTNLDLDAQTYLYDLLNSDNYVDYPNDDFQAGVSVLDTQTGQVLALGGGRNSEGQLAYSRATELDRSVGSTMKPLTVYGPAIENLKYSTAHILDDSKYSFPTGDSLGNYDGRYEGDIPMRRALVDSRNVPTARLLEEVGLDKADSFVKGLGISLNNGDGLYWSNAIGGDVTPMQLSASYAAFANEGNYTDPYTVSSISLQDGQEIDLTPETTQAMSDYTAYMVTDMLKDVANKYSEVTDRLGNIPNAGKTGTTNYTNEQIQKYNIPQGNFPDRWYAGYTPNYSISVWTGYDYQFESGHNLSYSNKSGTLAIDIYGLMMQFMTADGNNPDWQKPSDVESYSIVKGSNPPTLANTSQSSTKELFVKGNKSELPQKAEEETTSKNEKPAAPTDLTASYDTEEKRIKISWKAPSDVKVSHYKVTIDGKSSTTDGTSYDYPNPETGKSVSISVSTVVNDQESNPVTIKVDIPDEDEEDDENEDEDDSDETTSEESESSSSSSSETSAETTSSESKKRMQSTESSKAE